MLRPALVLALVSAASVLTGGAAASHDPVRLTVAQADARSSPAPPSLTVFLDLVDAQGEPPATLDPANVTVTIGSERATVLRAEPFTATGEGIAYIFMVDVSRSISLTDMARVRDAIRQWLAPGGSNTNAGTADNDRFALIAFGDDVTIVSDFTRDRAAFERSVATLTPRARTTQLHTAVQRAIEASRRRDPDLPARRVAVLLSDGQDEGSGLTADDVAALLRQERLAVYAIGYSRLAGAARTRGLDALRRFARNSGGQFVEASRDLAERYAEMRRAIARVFAVSLRCETCVSDGRLQHVTVDVKTGSRVLSDGIDLRLTADAGASAASPSQAPPLSVSIQIERMKQRERHRQRVLMAQGAGTLAILAVAGGLGWWWKRRARRTSKVATPLAADTRDRRDQRGDAHGAAAANHAKHGVSLTFHFRGRRAPAPVTIVLRDRLIIGSDAASAVVVPDDRDVAGAHCELSFDRGHVALRQLDATRTTLVNGAAIAPASRYRLENGDVLLVGRTELRLTLGEESV